MADEKPTVDWQRITVDFSHAARTPLQPDSQACIGIAGHVCASCDKPRVYIACVNHDGREVSVAVDVERANEIASTIIATIAALGTETVN